MKKITWKKAVVLLVVLVLYSIVSNPSESIKSFKEGMKYAMELRK